MYSSRVGRVTLSPLVFEKIYDSPENIKKRIHTAVLSKYQSRHKYCYEYYFNSTLESPNVKRVTELEEYRWIRKHKKVKVFKASIEARRNIILLFKSLDIYCTGKLTLDNLCEVLEFLGSEVTRLELDQYLKLHCNTNVLNYSQFHDFVSINSIVDFSPVVYYIYIILLSLVRRS